MIEGLTGQEDLLLLGRLRGLSPRAARQRAEVPVETFELSDASRRPVRGYSGGMRRRLEIAASLASSRNNSSGVTTRIFSRGQVSALLALQRSAGKAAVCGLLQPSLGQARPAQVQRRIFLQAPAAQPVDLTEVLEAHKLDKPGPLRDWFNTQVKPGLLGQFGFQRFAGYLSNPKNEYSFSVAVDKAVDAITFTELTQAVHRGLNTHILSKKIETGHSSLGNVKLLARSGFPAAIKNSYEKSQVIKELESQVGTS